MFDSTTTVAGIVINPHRQTQLRRSIQSTMRRAPPASARARTDTADTTASYGNKFPVHEVDLICLRGIALGNRAVTQLHLRDRSSGT